MSTPSNPYQSISNLPELYKQSLNSASSPAPVTSGMGTKAPSPSSNIPPVTNTLTPPAKTTPEPTGTGNTDKGLYNAPLRPYSEAVRTYQNYDPSQDPNVLAAQERQRNEAKSYTEGQLDRGTLPNIGGYQSNLMGLASARYGALAPVFNAQVSQAQTGAQQKQAGLYNAAGFGAPHWNGYAGLDPYSNQPIGNTGGGGGTGGGGNSLNNIATWGANIDYATKAAGDVKNYETSISTARNQGNTLVGQLNSTPEYNQDPVNVWNSLKNFLQTNVSNPKYANIETSLSNVLSGYASVLGQDVVTSLVRGSQAPSLGAFLKNLDELANKKIESTKTIGLGGAPVQAPNYGSVQTPTAPTATNGINPTSQAILDKYNIK